ncbi:hypothetical protein [Halarcobacter anaerophilus]|jgi:hypothetical protein|uniref:Uncharacterized protein n=1 Tax=Halarcobacter anaerophilus TaxID=877500 RepID=A0A4Q0XYB6_9BACT|nr:hypothetical protein [Halarcobacter anaerophilus]QDF29713.1 putative membrane protein [Halarcobacter anaerophilus]RXJ62636.1 hypothetical protein CRV06_09215 [Halarcobacter anaerophilus]
MKKITHKEDSFKFYEHSKDFDFEKSIVTNFIEKFLPIIFWLGFSIIIFNALNESIGLFKWNFLEGVFTFCKIFVPYTIAYLIVFYILFLLKGIRDSLDKK